MTEVLRAVPYGPGALAALRDMLADLRGGDPLAPVDVAVPSSFTGITVRRRLAAPGLVGVRFGALPRLIAARAAGELAARGRRPLTPAGRRAAARAVLLAGQGALADAARRAPGTVDVVAGVFAELDDAEAGEGALAGQAGWASELAGLYGSYLAAVPGMARPAEIVDAACGAAGATPVVVYLPRWLTAGELRFCRALAGRGMLRAVLGFTGDPGADADAAAIRDALAAHVPSPHVPLVQGVQVATLPDAEEEVQNAVRRVLSHLAAGRDARPDRTGITYRAAVPYARLAAEKLSAAGLPYHAPRQRALAQSVAGRALLGLLALPAENWSRAAVLAFLRDCPVRDGTGPGALLPVTRWQRQARQAGLTQGLGQWEDRLESLARRTEAWAAGSEQAGELEDRRRRAAELAASARALAAFVTGTAERVRAVTTAPDWAGAAAAAGAALAHYLGGPQAAAAWGAAPDAPPGPGLADPGLADRGLADPGLAARCEAERAAYEQVSAVVESLGALDAARVPVSGQALTDVLEQELSRQITESGGAGRGVLVGPVWDFAGADLDLLIVVGAAEGRYPPRGTEHPLLRDAARARAGLRTVGSQRSAERRDHLAAIRAAATVVLSHPAADTRAQRAAEPAPWLLELTSPRRRARDQQLAGPPSFAAAVYDARLPAATEGEFDIRLIMGAAPAGPAHPLARAVPALGRGLAASRQRAAGVFGPWTGALSPPPAGASPADPVTTRLSRPLSATSLQEYAECPFRYFLASVLGVHVTSEPDEEHHDPAERGSAMHAVLENLVKAAIEAGKQPWEPWTAGEHGNAQQMLGESARRMAAEGRAGRPAVWEVHLSRWRRQLRQMLLADDAYRATRAARPVAAEHGFGKGTGGPPLAVELPGGPVELAGFVDRIDVTAAGDLVVIDYKTGKSAGYVAFPVEGAAGDGGADLTERGRRLQLPLYALVAHRDFGAAPARVSAYYWFVDEGAVRRGGPITEADQERFREVLGVIAAGIRGGSFPARPGVYDPYFRSFSNCRWCKFDRVCGSGRGELWQRVRTSARAGRYAALAEPPGEAP